MSTRTATHAGSWYSGDGKKLSQQMDAWLDAVDGGEHPVANARIIIAPHAGYSYSGPTAAWAYKALDVSKAKRVFLLGPSHHVYLEDCAVSQCAYYETPMGNLTVDQATTSELLATGSFSKMKKSVDEDEHSLELHLPYIYKRLNQTFGNDPAKFPPLVPIMVGNTNAQAEAAYGAILAPYLADPTNVFVVSSDFAHWGLRFSYTYYLPSSESNPAGGKTLRSSDRGPFKEPQIYDSIARVDQMSMDAIKTGEHSAFLSILRKTGNTVCGRHPIGIIMATREALLKDGKIKDEESRFQFVQYARSSNCTNVGDSSVSYVSGYAKVE